MYCKKCGFNLADGAKICSFCGQKVDKNDYIEAQSEQTSETINEKTNEQPINQDYEQPKEYERVESKTIDLLRNENGFIDINTKWWIHLLIASGGYLFLEIFSIIFGRILFKISMSKGNDFSCVYGEEGVAGCPVEIRNLYNKIASIDQVVGELLLIAIIAIIFHNFLKIFFSEAKQKQTWKWFGIGLGINYGGNILYNMILTAANANATSSNQDSVNELLFGSPLLGFLFVVIAAPLFEEIIFRFGIFRIFTFKSKKLAIVGIALTAFLFASVHFIATFQEAFADPANPNYEILKSDLLSLPIYLLGGVCLTLTYYKSKNLLASMSVHMTINFVSFVSIFLLQIADELQPEVTSNIIRFFHLLIC